MRKSTGTRPCKLDPACYSGLVMRNVFAARSAGLGIAPGAIRPLRASPLPANGGQALTSLGRSGGFYSTMDPSRNRYIFMKTNDWRPFYSTINRGAAGAISN
jgi:hypothetical protein